MTPELNHRRTQGVAPQSRGWSRLSILGSHIDAVPQLALGIHNVVGTQMPCEISRRT